MNIKINAVIPPLKGEAKLRAISSFVFQHLLSAVLFARKVRIIEQENAEQSFGEFFTEIRSYASASIMASAAAIEANINELFISHGGPLRGKIENFDKKFYGRYGIESIPILKKYLKALKILNIDYNLEEEAIYKDCNCLIILRNELIHFKPNWDLTPEDKRVELKNMGFRFMFSPFVGEGADLISMKCMGYGCAKWGVETAIKFIDKFSDVSKLSNRIETFRNRFNLEEESVS